jgi:hypothetical protein
VLATGACGRESSEPAAAPPESPSATPSPTETVTASASPTATVTATATATETVTATPSATGSAGASAAPTESPSDAADAGAEDTGTCTDLKGDEEASGSAGDLLEVVLDKRGDQIGATFTTAKAAPTKGTVLWSIFAVAADGDTVVQLGAKIVDGKKSSVFVFDPDSTPEQTNLPASITLKGATMSTLFPASAVARLGDGARWRAALNVEGTDTDDCPNQPASVSAERDTLEFPADWL